MKRLSFIALLFVLPLSTPAWAQTDTLPDGLGNEVRTPEGLKNVIDRKDPRFVMADSNLKCNTCHRKVRRCTSHHPEATNNSSPKTGRRWPA